MVVIRFFLFLWLSLFILPVFSQGELSDRNEKKIRKKAEFYYEDEDNKSIPKALNLYEELLKNKPDDTYYNLMVGICYSYFKNKKEVGLKKLLAVKNAAPELNEVNFYLGRSYAINNRFEEAISSYNRYLSGETVSDNQKELVKQNIIYCQNAKKNIKDSLKVKIVSLGSPINTNYSEYAPIITPDESVMFFTYRGINSKGGLMSPTGEPDDQGDYYEDIMVSYKVNNKWLSPTSIANKINTEGHDAGIAISTDGQLLFIYKQTKKDGGDIYYSNLDGENWSKPKKLKGEVNTTDWEGSATLASDGKVLYFASTRAGGFGGRDIYSANLQSDGSWGEVKNLGDVINTRFDEDAPFIHPDRKTLYYSSKGHNSMGGYDIFYTYLSDEGWDKSKNIGYPINTIDDDRYYVLSADAKTGYYSTAGRSENGNHDIYSVSPGHFGTPPILALIIGVTQAEGEFVEADITVTNNKTGELTGKFKSNATSGKYVLALTPGNKYKIAIEVEGYATKVEYIDIESLATYVEVQHDFNLNSKENIVGISDNTEPLQGKIDSQISRYRKEIGKEKEAVENYVEENIHITITDPDSTVVDTEKVINLSEINNIDLKNEKLKNAVDKTITGLNFKVEIGKVLDVNDFKLQHLEKYGKISTKTYPDGNTHYTFGTFSTLKEADAFKKMLISEEPDQKDVFITVFVFGKRKTIEEFKKDAETNSLDGFSWFMGKDLKDKNVYKKMLKMVANLSVEGLIFRVQIGAYHFPENYEYQYLQQYGTPLIVKYPDQITRFTLGEFMTLGEAKVLRQAVIKIGQKDAWITPFYNGKRINLKDLFKGEFYGDNLK